ncbi:hypothetical protein [Plebeiibacterium sediminum]|uniref:Uncharacterized protein n=1 Tax=Plebeiibacterium sediminum TaxID=2992112 RepID=A0AAE3SDJ9_9BACT|nr:hypothetical protein [Plebeiobacterium sediminum]MCW3784907.1 hypothetical protein [Plebeiobacterium sediminum]
MEKIKNINLLIVQEIETYLMKAFRVFNKKELNYSLSELTNIINRNSDFAFNKRDVKAILLSYFKVAPSGNMHYVYYFFDDNWNASSMHKKGWFYRFIAKDIMPKSVFDAYFKEANHCKIKHLGICTTIGELRTAIADYPAETSFGFRNQPMQHLHEVSYNDGKTFVVFQEPINS